MANFNDFNDLELRILEYALSHSDENDSVDTIKHMQMLTTIKNLLERRTQRRVAIRDLLRKERGY